jgi:hypothetical protein
MPLFPPGSSLQVSGDVLVSIPLDDPDANRMKTEEAYKIHGR